MGELIIHFLFFSWRMPIPWHFKKDVNLGALKQEGCRDVSQHHSVCHTSENQLQKGNEKKIDRRWVSTETTAGNCLGRVGPHFFARPCALSDMVASSHVWILNT